MLEAFLGAAVMIVVVAVAEIVRRRRAKNRCPKCASESLLVLHESDTMRECNACGYVFSL